MALPTEVLKGCLTWFFLPWIKEISKEERRLIKLPNIDWKGIYSPKGTNFILSYLLKISPVAVIANKLLV